jgi:hypothetical protein
MKKHDFEDFARTSAGRRAATLLLTHAVKPVEIFAIVLAEVTEIRIVRSRRTGSVRNASTGSMTCL